MFSRNFIRPSHSCLLLSRRNYAIKQQAKKINLYLDKIGDENTKESQKTIKIVRMIGAGTVITVICSLLWASTLSAPVKEVLPEIDDLSKDVRRR